MRLGDPSPASRARLCYLALALFTLALVVAFIAIDTLAPAGRRLAKVAGVDPPDYFSVSHSVLFDHDFDLSNEWAVNPPADSIWTRVSKVTGHPASAHPIGYPLLAMPFLAAGTAVDRLAGNPADGYSRFAMLGYCLTNVVLTGLGMIALFYFLLDVSGELWGHRAPGFPLLATIAVFFGTSVAYYTFSQMSHAATFFATSLFLSCWWKIRESTAIKGWLLLGLFGGILSITRWQEVFFAGAPFLFDLANKKLYSHFRLFLRSRLAYVAVILLCWVPQLMEWKFMYGKYLANPVGEGFWRFPLPYVPQVLFSSQNGWFLWTPLCFLGACGLVYGLLRFGRVFLPWLIVIALDITLISSTPSPEGADAFSIRYLTSCAALIALGLLVLLNSTRRWMRWTVVSLSTLCCLFTCLFAVQFRLDLIPRHERLTAAELFTDKLRLLQVNRQKHAADQAEDLVKQGNAQAAIQVLEQASARYGQGRYILTAMRDAYRAGGDAAKAENANRQLDHLLQSRLQ